MSSDDTTSTSVSRSAQAEKRFKEIALRIRSMPVLKVESMPYDVKGIIDFIIYIRNDDSKSLMMPVQIKNSACAAKSFRVEHSEIIKLGLVLIVVNDNRSDEEIESELIQHMRSKIQSGIDTAEYNRTISRCIEMETYIQKHFGKESFEFPRKHGSKVYGARIKKTFVDLPGRCRGMHLIERFIRKHAV